VGYPANIPECSVVSAQKYSSVSYVHSTLKKRKKEA